MDFKTLFQSPFYLKAVNHILSYVTHQDLQNIELALDERTRPWREILCESCQQNDWEDDRICFYCHRRICNRCSEEIGEQKFACFECTDGPNSKRRARLEKILIRENPSRKF